MAILTKEFQELGLAQTPEELSVELGEICAIKATDRRILIDTINAYIGSDFFVAHPDASYLHLELSGERLGCVGCSVDYKTEADVPEHSVPCTCGNPKHWLIKYEKENE